MAQDMLDMALACLNLLLSNSGRSSGAGGGFFGASRQLWAFPGEAYRCPKLHERAPNRLGQAEGVLF
eukprot:2328599-Alexandrium_andersonii.AAC.1